MDPITLATTVAGVAFWSTLVAFLLVFALLAALWALVRRWRGRRYRGAPASLDEMPGHPESVRYLDDPTEDEIFGDLAEQLLDEGLGDLCERTGWFQ